MLGVKANVPKIMDYLKQQQISNICSTEFHQGHTTRWAIAWSFQQHALTADGNRLELATNLPVDTTID